MDKPIIIHGNLFVDDRGKIRFVNDFNFEGIKRFYQVSNHSKGFKRAWHGHKNEAKYVYVSQGSAIVAAIPIGTDLSDTTSGTRVVLSSTLPKIFYIPKGYWNGFVTLEENTQVFFFSTSTLEESKNDDIRLNGNHFSYIWKIEER